MTKLNRRLRLALPASMAAGLILAPKTTKADEYDFKFSNGLWSNAFNWQNGAVPPSSFDDVLYMPGGGTPYNDGGGVPYAVMTNDLPGQGPADVLGNQFFELGTLLLGDGGGQVQGVQTDLQLSQIVDQAPAYVPNVPNFIEWLITNNIVFNGSSPTIQIANPGAKLGIMASVTTVLPLLVQYTGTTPGAAPPALTFGGFANIPNGMTIQDMETDLTSLASGAGPITLSSGALGALGDFSVNVVVQGAGNHIYTNGHNLTVELTGDRNAFDGIGVTATAPTIPGPTGEVTLAGTSVYSGSIDVAGTTVNVPSSAVLEQASITLDNGGALGALGDIAVNVAVQGAGNNIYTNGHNIAVVLTGDRNALDGISVTATASTTPGPTGDVTLAGSAAYAGGIDIAGTSVTALNPLVLGQASITIEHHGILHLGGSPTFNNGFTLQNGGGVIAASGAISIPSLAGTNPNPTTMDGVYFAFDSGVFDGTTMTSVDQPLPSGNPAPPTFTVPGAISYAMPTGIWDAKLVVNGTMSNSSSPAVVGNGGELTGSGVIASPVNVHAGGALSGSLTINNTVTGAGLIAPSDGPEILTASQLAPSAGMSFAYEFTQLHPNYTQATNSGNDLFHLNGTQPFATNLTDGNSVSIYFSYGTQSSSLVGQIFTGGFYTDTPTDFSAQVASAHFQYYYLDAAAGAYSFDGLNWDLLPSANVLVSTVQEQAYFDGGPADGYVTQFDVVSVPEPMSAMTVGALGGIMLLRGRRAPTARMKPR